MDEHPYRVGSAMAYLVRRMGTFCNVLDEDVLLYPHRDRRSIPERMPAVDVIRAQARMYSQHRGLYPEDQQETLDAGIGLLADPDNAVKARDGFLYALSSPS